MRHRARREVYEGSSASLGINFWKCNVDRTSELIPGKEILARGIVEFRRYII